MLINERTPQLSHLSWVTSAGVHAAVIVALGTFVSVPVVDQAEVAGARTVIHAVISEPAPVASTDSPPVEVTRPTEPDTEPETEPDAAEPPAKNLPDRPAPEPLSRDVRRAQADLAELAQGDTRLPRQTQPEPIARAAVRPESVGAPPSVETSRAVTPPEVHRNPTRNSSRPPLPRRQRPVIDDMQELAEADLPPEPPAAAPQSPGTSETTPARVLVNPSPVYPPDALRRGLEGLVLLRVTIGPDGRVTEVSVARSSGVRKLDESARDAVRRWKFEPAMRDGNTVEWTARLPVRFRLK